MQKAPLARRMAAMLAARGRPDLWPAVIPVRWINPVFWRFKWVFLSRPVGDSLTDGELEALIAHTLIISPAGIWRIYATVGLCFTPFVLPVVFFFDSPQTAMPLMLVLGIALIILLLNQRFTRWYYEPKFRIYLDQGGDPALLATALMKLTKITWHDNRNGWSAMLQANQMVDILADLSGVKRKALLRNLVYPGSLNPARQEEPERKKRLSSGTSVLLWLVGLIAVMIFLIARST